MDKIQEWSELIAYWTASMAALIYIFDTSFIYLSGIKKQLKLKKKIPLNEISQPSPTSSSPSESIILERFSQHPQYRRNYVVQRENENPIYSRSDSELSLSNKLNNDI